ncbi:NAD(P)H-quinone oxidoreductase [Bartonella sp. DGB1]|uniref:NAD(P)H-quinone oxidoreductase n=1 Tax=Bartonella sp. DGB1 TaxID=3239807 RepID=UPI003524952D
MKKPSKISAIKYTEYGSPDVLHISEIELPPLKPKEILIKTYAAGINRPDILQRMGYYPPPIGASPILGLEVAGIIADVGSQVSQYKIGDAVMALLTGGGYATYTIANEACCLAKPENLSYLQAAALPEVLYTNWYNIFMLGKLKKGEIILIHGGSSGIGTIAIQLAKIFGAKVIITAGSKEKCEICSQLGADLAINYKEQNFVEEILNYTHGIGVNVILDMVGGDYVSKNYQVAALDARILQIAFLNGNKAQINLATLLTKRIQHRGSTLRNHSNEFKYLITKQIKSKILPLIKQKKIIPYIDKIFPLNEASEAHQYMERGNHIGKIMLEIN